MTTKLTPRVNWSNRIVCRAALLFACSAISSQPLFGANANWTNGAGDNLWTSASNWSAAYPQTTTDVATFNNNSQVAGVISLGGNLSIGGVAVGGSTVKDFTLGSSGQTLTINGAAAQAVYISGAAHTVRVGADLALAATGGVSFDVYNNAVVNLSKVSLLGPLVLRASSSYGSGVINLNGDINNTGNTGNIAIRIDGGTVNWNVGTFNNTKTASSVFTVTGRQTPGVLNFQKSQTTAANVGIALGYATAASDASVYGTVNGVTINSNITTTAKTANVSGVNTVGANDTSATAQAPSTVTFTGSYIAAGSNYAQTHRFYAAANNKAIFQGAIQGSAAVASGGSVMQKTGAGTVVFGGSVENTSVLPLEVMEGRLELSKNGCNAISGNVKVDSGATLALGASNQIANTSAMTLAGGAFEASIFSEELGTLTVTANSVLDFENGGRLSFANSNGLWTEGTTLTISGAIIEGESLRFGADSTGLSESQLSQIRFSNYTSGYYATIDDLGYIAVVPEPGTVAFSTVGTAILLCWLRRRKNAVILN